MPRRDRDRDAAIDALLDRAEIEDVLLRYASTTDRFDYAGLREVFTDDARARFGDEWLEGADAIVTRIRRHTIDFAWQHHQLSVYHVDVDGDTARALTYTTSHQVTKGIPDQVRLIVGRYHDELRRTDQGWRITSKEMELLLRDLFQRTGTDADAATRPSDA